MATAEDETPRSIPGAPGASFLTGWIPLTATRPVARLRVLSGAEAEARAALGAPQVVREWRCATVDARSGLVVVYDAEPYAFARADPGSLVSTALRVARDRPRARTVARDTTRGAPGWRFGGSAADGEW